MLGVGGFVVALLLGELAVFLRPARGLGPLPVLLRRRVNCALDGLGCVPAWFVAVEPNKGLLARSTPDALPGRVPPADRLMPALEGRLTPVFPPLLVAAPLPPFRLAFRSSTFSSRHFSISSLCCFLDDKYRCCMSRNRFSKLFPCSSICRNAALIFSFLIFLRCLVKREELFPSLNRKY